MNPFEQQVISVRKQLDAIIDDLIGGEINEMEDRIALSTEGAFLVEWLRYHNR